MRKCEPPAGPAPRPTHPSAIRYGDVTVTTARTRRLPDPEFGWRTTSPRPRPPPFTGEYGTTGGSADPDQLTKSSSFQSPFVRDHPFVDIAPAPFLARFGGTNDRMSRFMEVCGGVAVLGLVTASRLAADQALTQMNPAVSEGDALRALVLGRRDGTDGIAVATGTTSAQEPRHQLPDAAAEGTHRRTPRTSYRDNNWCTCVTHTDPSPTADATRFTEPARTSPTAKTPGRLVSKGSG